MDSRGDGGGCLWPAQSERIKQVQALNDALRVHVRGGHLCISSGILALGYDAYMEARAAIAAFTEFDAGNDPYGEHDFGAVEVQGQRIFWKIDCYDKDETYASPDPADPGVTSRFLTIMLASEY